MLDSAVLWSLQLMCSTIIAPPQKILYENFFSYIKMSKTSSARYYQKTKRDFNKARERLVKVSIRNFSLGRKLVQANVKSFFFWKIDYFWVSIRNISLGGKTFLGRNVFIWMHQVAALSTTAKISNFWLYSSTAKLFEKAQQICLFLKYK